MQTGKLSEPALKRSVLRQFYTEPARCRERYGADCAEQEGREGYVSLYSVANEVPGFAHDPGKLVMAVSNNLWACGARPDGFLVSAVLPETYEESRLRADMQRIRQAAEDLCAQAPMQRAAGSAGVCVQTSGRILGGHTQVSDRVREAVYTVTGIGYARREECRQQVLLRPGDDLVVIGRIALGGTAALAIGAEKELRARFPFSLVERAKSFEQQMDVGKAARTITRFGRTAVHDLSFGGIFNALWEMADRAGTGLEVDLRKIPIYQETIELCEYFDANPYYLYSAGALLAGTVHGEALVSQLAAQGMEAAVIGRATDGNRRVIRNGEEVRYIDRPKQDEWYRIAGRI